MMMNDILKKVNNMKPKYLNLYLFSKAKSKMEYEVFSTKSTDLEMLSDLKTAIHSQIHDYIVNEETENPIDYNPLINDKNIVQKIECSELHKLSEFVEDIERDPILYTETALTKGHSLWIIAIVMDDGENKIFSFQKIRNKTFLENKKINLILNGNLEKFDKPLLPLESKIDCICSLNDDNPIMYIFHNYYFEQIFGFEEKFRNEIKEKLEKFENRTDKSVKLDVKKLFSKIENNKRSLKKLYMILNNDNYNYLTEENIRKIEEKSENIKFNRSNGELHLDEFEDVKKILNLLNDDYLEGILSQKPFKTSNKIDL